MQQAFSDTALIIELLKFHKKSPFSFIYLNIYTVQSRHSRI